ncbi:MAG: hypothetical protein K2P84_11230 [Undibacterium sp.]|nr:hypothetical protein [Undibacterium sp.]
MMITASVEKMSDGSYEVADQATKQVYGHVKSKPDAIDLVREKTGDLDITVLEADD